MTSHMSHNQDSPAASSNAQKVNSPTPSAASLIRQFFANNSNTDGKPIEDFIVSVQGDVVKIHPSASTHSTYSISIQGSQALTNGLDNTKNGNLTIHGEAVLHGLLIELVMTKKCGQTTIDLDRALFLGGKLEQLSNLIRTSWWHNLTRSLDISSPALYRIDTKVRTDDPRPRIYVPRDAPEQYDYYTKLAKDHPDLRLDVQSLPPPPLDLQYIKELDTKPGALALAMDTNGGADGTTLRPMPFVVPGGRFNELYGWDTYFTVLGLLVDGHVDICISILKNFCFCLEHYGKIFNANRTYYLGRSQPPFLTSMGLAICEKLGKDNAEASNVIKIAVIAAIKEYYTVWMTKPRYDEGTGLSRYSGEGLGFPPECEATHFDDIVIPLAAKYNMEPADFVKAYDKGDIQDAELDQYLKHDLAGRESGHDTTYRFVGRAANLATVDLNSCLYKYEIDIAHILDTYFGGSIEIPSNWLAEGQPQKEVSSEWTQRAERRHIAMDKYLWCQEKGMFFDYDTETGEPMYYEAATTIWPLWSQAASSAQAETLVAHALDRLEVYGGLLSSTESSRGEISSSRPLRQWDYPHGWAPHQMLAWVGLLNYGYVADAERLIYRWISMVVRTFSDYNGLVVEKYDITSRDKSHVVEAEYGNQGSDFSSEVQTGFAWTNASLVCGKELLRRLRHRS